MITKPEMEINKEKKIINEMKSISNWNIFVMFETDFLITQIFAMVTVVVIEQIIETSVLIFIVALIISSMFFNSIFLFYRRIYKSGIYILTMYDNEITIEKIEPRNLDYIKREVNIDRDFKFADTPSFNKSKSKYFTRMYINGDHYGVYEHEELLKSEITNHVKLYNCSIFIIQNK